MSSDAQLPRETDVADVAPIRFGVRTLLIATMVIAILLAVIVPTFRAARNAARQMRCKNNLRQIGLAMQNYCDVHKTYPWAITYADDGTPTHSWRVRIMPYIEQSPFYDLYLSNNEPWNGPNNRLLGDLIPDTILGKDGLPEQRVLYPHAFRCPSAPRSQHPMCTNYVMLIDDRPGKPNGPPNRPGSVPPNTAIESAVIVIEIADCDIHWMEPRDLLLSELSLKINDRSKPSIGSYHGGSCVLRVDGTVEILDQDTTAEQLKALLMQ